MSVFLKAELETEVTGDGDGFISILQKKSNGEESVVWLSVHQFETIVNLEKHLVSEALGTE